MTTFLSAVLQANTLEKAVADWTAISWTQLDQTRHLKLAAGHIPHYHGNGFFQAITECCASIC